jgi:putative FmdB family regulatory protein
MLGTGGGATDAPRALTSLRGATMATYEYQCEDCRKTFAIRERISEHVEKKRKRTECPRCHGHHTHQCFTPFYAKTSSKA